MIHNCIGYESTKLPHLEKQVCSLRIIFVEHIYGMEMKHGNVACFKKKIAVNRNHDFETQSTTFF